MGSSTRLKAQSIQGAILYLVQWCVKEVAQWAEHAELNFTAGVDILLRPLENTDIELETKNQEEVAIASTEDDQSGSLSRSANTAVAE